jgi:hypothetical protein
LRKERAGVDSFGNVWATDGAIVDVPDEQARELLRIPDGGFTEAGPNDTPTKTRRGGQPLRTPITETR